MRTGLAMSATLSSIKPLSLNRIDSTRNECTELLNQFPELTRHTTKGETVKHGITQTVSDRYPIPHIQDFTLRSAGSKIFSKIDLVRAYYQIPDEPSGVYKTAVTTPFRLFNFTRAPFGLQNSGQTFPHFINHVTRGLDFVFVYLDDLLVTSPDHQTHKKHLKILFKWLTEYGIIIGPDKVNLERPS